MNQQVELKPGQIVRHDIEVQDYADSSGNGMLIVSIAFAVLIVMYLWSIRK